jgi:hypothetical protein
MATSRLIGCPDATPPAGGAGANYFQGSRFQALYTGNLTEFRVKSAAAGNIKIAIYADNGGEPGSRLWYDNTGRACSAGWNTFAVSPALYVIKDAYYWLMCNVDTQNTAANYSVSEGELRYKVATYSSFTFPDPAGSGFSSVTLTRFLAGWGILILSPSGISQPLAYGVPGLSRIVKPQGHQQVIAYGTPAVSIAGIVIGPQGVAVIVSCGAPSLRYPQTISPPGLDISITYGVPTILVAGQGVIFILGHQQVIGYGIPTILKYVWHVILDGRYHVESPETNRTFVIGRDVNGNPVWGEAHDSAESALVGERLDFQPDPAIPTTAQAADVAAAVLSKMRLSKKRGVILIPYNCGQELWDVVQITDAGANQSAVKFRVVGIRFEYHPGQARYQHKLILGAP